MGAWEMVASLGAELLVLQEVHCTVQEVQEIATKAKAQVVHGRAVGGKVLVSALAWAGKLQHVADCPTGQSHHFRWRCGKRHLEFRIGYYQGGTREEKDVPGQVLGSWLEAAELAGSRPWYAATSRRSGRSSSSPAGLRRRVGTS